MIVDSPQAFRAQIEAGWLKSDGPAVPRACFLVEPSGFRLSRQSAKDNIYMDLSVAVDPDRALDQHRRLSERITACGIPAVRFPGHATTPDELFPNNVFGTIPGRSIIGRMLHP
ncbi:MAG: arginine deiminase-related protein, partial [Wenzhouxiangella sp.]